MAKTVYHSFGPNEIPLVFRPRTNTQRITLVRYGIAPMTVSYPRGMAHEKVMKFVRSTNFYKDLEQIVSRPVQNPILDGYQTRFHTFRIRESLAGQLTAIAQDKEMILYVPTNLSITSHFVQRFAYEALREVIRAEAASYIPPLVARCAAQYGLKYDAVRIADMHSSWGRCGRGQLRFSIYVMLYPDRFLESVIWHELAHLTYMDHSPAFWQLLSEYLGTDARRERHAMEKHELNIPKIY